MQRATTWDVVVLGGANSDYTVLGARLPAPGATVEGETFLEGPGGKGANQAVAAARLGARVALLARVGLDARGDALRGALAFEGVATDLISRDPQAPTGIALIHVAAGGEKQIAAAPGANRRLTHADVEAAEHALGSTRVLLAPLEAPLEVLAAATTVAKAGGARFVLDAAPPVALPAALARQIDVLRLNSDEAHALTGVSVHDLASARTATRHLLRWGVGAVLVQAGTSGDLLLTADEDQFLPRLPVTSVDATGAGDALAAALAVALAEGQPLPTAARFAHAAAALATTVAGAQAGLPTRAAVEAMLLKVEG